MSSIKRMRITVEGKTYDVAVELLEDAVESVSSPVIAAPAGIPGIAPRFAPPSAEHRGAPGAPAHSGVTGSTASSGPRPHGAVVCPLSGMVVSVDVTAGQYVNAGDVLVTLEAMKMKTPVRATSAGTVKSIEAKAGVAVEEGAVLLVLES
jgi:glutaconyl-CoA/methylmalonyl-CoA decarboxylase subunit gamma